MKYVYRKDRHGVAAARLAANAMRNGKITWLDILSYSKYVYGAKKARRLVRAYIWWKSVFAELGRLAEPGTRVRNKAERVIFAQPPYEYGDAWLLSHDVGQALELGPRVYDPYCGWRSQLGWLTKMPVLW